MKRPPGFPFVPFLAAWLVLFAFLGNTVTGATGKEARISSSPLRRKTASFPARTCTRISSSIPRRISRFEKTGRVHRDGVFPDVSLGGVSDDYDVISNHDLFTYELASGTVDVPQSTAPGGRRFLRLEIVAP